MESIANAARMSHEALDTRSPRERAAGLVAASQASDRHEADGELMLLRDCFTQPLRISAIGLEVERPR